MEAVLKRAAKEIGVPNLHGRIIDIWVMTVTLISSACFPGSAQEIDEIPEGSVFGQNTIYQLLLVHHPQWGSNEGAYEDSLSGEGDCGALSAKRRHLTGSPRLPSWACKFSP
ncbi:hypothetical protein M9458_038024, partial [Cirrhinus mrigala]